MNTTTVIHVPYEDLHPAAYNRESGNGTSRSGFDKKSLGELADSIREQSHVPGVAGIVQPLIVRKVNGKPGFEIIAGERRWTATGLLNKKLKVPCLVRQADDAQAREINTIENLQRTGLNPVEEAYGYQRLLELKVAEPYTIERIATRVGKSPAFVYARLKLLKAPPLALRLMYSGKMSHSHLLLVARIPDAKLANKATIEIMAPIHRTEEGALDLEVEPLSQRAAKNWIRDHYMVRVKDSPFDPEDETLVPATYEFTDTEGKLHRHQSHDGKPPIVGPGIKVERVCGGKCSDCPCLTGNMKKLFPDVESSDVCTNTVCFKKKKEADWKRANAKAKEEGAVLLKDTQATRLFDSGKLVAEHEYVDLNAAFPGEKKKSWSDVLGEHVPETLVRARDDRRKLHVLLPLDEALQAAKKAGRKLKLDATPRRDPRQDYATQEAERQRRKAVGEAAADLALVELRTRIVKGKADKKFWLFLAEHYCHSHEFLVRRELKSEKHLSQHLKKLNEDELRAAVVEAALCLNTVAWQGDFYEGFANVCEFFGVDLKKHWQTAAKLPDLSKAEFNKALDAVSPEAK